MRVAELRKLLAKSIEHGLPILITGAPGVGKSDIVSQAAQEAGANVILSHPVVSDPTDAKGLPWVSKDQESATFLPFGDLSEAINATKKTVWFLDDLGQASPAVQASFMQLLLARRVNGHILPECVTFCAATNRRTDRAGVTGILEPVKSRFVTIVELEPHLDDWCDWAVDSKSSIPPEIVSFLRFRPDLLSDFKPTADLTQSPSPRTWANAAKLVNLRLGSLEFAAVSGAIGAGAATELVAFLQVYRAMPDLDDIIANPEKAKIPSKPAALYAVSTGLAYKATGKNFPRLVTYANRLEGDKKGEFAVLLLRDTVRRCPEVCDTKEFIKLASSETGKLILGN